MPDETTQQNDQKSGADQHRELPPSARPPRRRASLRNGHDSASFPLCRASAESVLDRMEDVRFDAAARKRFLHEFDRSIHAAT
ncbi:MAG: hypothetical protein ACREIT_02695, partial [Tepidisphaeraceae bacterium]